MEKTNLNNFLKIQKLVFRNEKRMTVKRQFSSFKHHLKCKICHHKVFHNSFQSGDTKLYKQTTKVEKLLLKLQRCNCSLSLLSKCRDTILKIFVKIPRPFSGLFPLCFTSDLISLVTCTWRLTSSMFTQTISNVCNN